VQRKSGWGRSFRCLVIGRDPSGLPGTEKLTGVGEPGVPPLPPAVANAVAGLGEPRVGRLPFRPEGLVAT
jgi:CO/xanthine dehydrogenase Mo-binding subunit